MRSRKTGFQDSFHESEGSLDAKTLDSSLYYYEEGFYSPNSDQVRSRNTAVRFRKSSTWNVHLHVFGKVEPGSTFFFFFFPLPWSAFAASTPPHHRSE